MFTKLTGLNRATMGLTAWIALQFTDVDDQLLVALGAPEALAPVLELGLVVAWIILDGRYPTRQMATTALGPLVHFAKDNPPGHRAGRVKKTNSNTEIDALLDALREVVSSTRKDNRRRDQLIAALHRAGLSYRQIAPYADVSYVKVGEIVLGTEPQEVTVRPLGRTYPLRYSEPVPAGMAEPFADDLTINWTAICPNQVISYMERHYQDRPDVTDAELQATLDELNGMNLPDPAIRPDWQWTVEDFRGLLQHALMRRRTVRPEEVATPFRQSALSQKHRLEGYGIDTLAEVRTRWADVMGRLNNEALRNFPQT